MSLRTVTFSGSVLLLLLVGCDTPMEPLGQPGGMWTAKATVRPSFIQPVPILGAREELDFWTGMAFFRDPWVSAPASTTARDGLGPLFNAQSCVSCHRAGGRGSSLLKDGDSIASVIKLGVVDEASKLSPHPIFGTQLNPRATFAYDTQVTTRQAGYFSGEAGFDVQFVNATVEHTHEILQRPRLTVDTDAVIGADETLTSLRIAPAIAGMGLLEAISDTDIQAHADPTDADGDGISGRTRKVWSEHLQRDAIGRFGWKATHATVADQTGAAFFEDIGISNPVFTGDNCTQAQSECKSQKNGDDAKEGVEIVSAIFDRVVFFVANLAPQPAGQLSPDVNDGRRLFSDTGCAACHAPSYEVKFETNGLIHTQTIWPYTDLLLHDMGEGLADTLPEPGAEVHEWRTAPLWGLGKALSINKDTGLLHDGRAATVHEAVLWHQGEASASTNAYLNLSEKQKQNLEKFIMAL